MNDSDHNRWSEDLGAYALGALDPPETAELERHLEGCERCRQELRWLEPAVQTLPDGIERQEPPPRLRQTLMAEVRADARVETREEERSAPVSPRRRWLLRPAVGLAALALLVAGVVGYEVGKDGGSDSRGADAPLVRQFGEITVKMFPEGEGGTLELSNVHELPPDKVLEAWVLREGQVEAVPALFVPDRHGRAETRIADMTGVAEVMVTEEPRGGSEKPTSEPIVEMSVPQ